MVSFLVGGFVRFRRASKASNRCADVQVNICKNCRVSTSYIVASAKAGKSGPTENFINLLSPL